MSVTWNSIFQQVADLLGAVAGATASTKEANYQAAISTSTVIGPDFTGTPIQDAAANVLAEIVEAISETPLHPEWQDFKEVTGSLASGDEIPALVNALPRIGRIGAVLDAADDTPLKRAPLDEVRSYNRFSATIYSQSDQYKFAEYADRVYHTRDNVVIEAFCFERPANFNGNIPIRDTHEQALVCGAVMRLAPKESMYGDLWDKTQATYTRHLAAIRELGNPQAYTEAAVAPSNV